jgi:CBS domain-containing protein
VKVNEVMTKDVVTCSPADTVESIVKIMSEKNISGIPVIEEGRLTGIITEEDIMKVLIVPEPSHTLWLPSPFEVLLEIPIKDVVSLRRMRQSYADAGHREVRDIMTKSVWTIEPDNDIEEAAAIMVRHRINRLPVLADGKLIGIVTRDDIIHGLGGKK